MATQAPEDQVEALEAQTSEAARSLYTVDASSDMLFVQTQAAAGHLGARALTTALSDAWGEYALAKDAIDRLRAALAAHDGRTVAWLLGPSAIVWPDGTLTGLRDLLGRLQVAVRALGDDVTRLADAARGAMARLDAAAGAARQLLVRAAAVGAADDVECRSLSAAIDRATAAVAADPTADGQVAELESMVTAARARVESMERHRQALPGMVAAADLELTEIERTVVAGAEAYARARDRIADAADLLQPLDLDADGDRSLRPWLARIKHQADLGEAETAHRAITAWKTSADGWLATARKVLDANRAPVARRDELRGLLDAYKAKAVAQGRAEDATLSDLFDAAYEVLHTKPCALDHADAAVRQYVEAVNRPAGGSAR